MKKNMTYTIVAVLVVVIIIAGAAAYLLYGGGGGGDTNPTATPSPTVNVGEAATLTFSANVTSQGQTTTYNWKGVDMHTAPTIRVDLPGYSYILNSTQQKSWLSTDNGATWTESTFNDDWPFWGNEWTIYVDNLTPGHWSGSGERSYEDAQGQAIVLFDIVVNPTIPDSTFATS